MVKVFQKPTTSLEFKHKSKFWHKIRQNPLSMLSMGFIAVWIIVAMLGYLITPDSTPHANMQNLELATHKPGHTAMLLHVRLNSEPQKVSLIQKMINGKKQEYNIIPIQRFWFVGAWLHYETYPGHPGFRGVEDRIWLPDVVYVIAPMQDTSSIANNTISFYMLNGQKKEMSIEELRIYAEYNHISNQTFLLGTDRFGRDMVSQIVLGARVSLAVGFISVLISLILGLTLGCIAGYFRGRLDDAIMWLINVIWSIPTLLLVIAITFALGKGFWQIFIAVGLTMWVDVARIARGQVLSIREKEFVLSARALGLSNFRIISRHILPNIIGPVVVISAANFASAILIEAGLSFLGIGVQPPMPSWGTMIREHYSYIILGKSYLAILPGVMIMLMVLAFMLLGNGMREAFDKSQKV